jgi:uncharacterized protein YndB with AHSA1/START domain
MSRNQIDIDVAPDAVFDVLADARSYARWVVGSRAVRAADPSWPAAGSVFDHAQGFGPLVLRDTTASLECRRPEYLRMRVHARPITTAYVTLHLQARDGGTRVVMEEGPANLLSTLVMNPLTDPLVHLRNAESLRRLKRLAEGTEPMPEGVLPPRGRGESWVTEPSG